ncbi:MAG: hypothetical protein U0Z17_06680 [Bacteroidales bacterium]
MKLIFNYSMSVIYLLAGLYLLVFGWFILTDFQNKGVGVLMIVYGLFRAYRIYNSRLQAKSEAEPDENKSVNSIDPSA